MKAKIILICCGAAAFLSVVFWGFHLNTEFNLYDDRLGMVKEGDSLSRVVEVMGEASRVQGPGENIGPSVMDNGVAKRFLYVAPAIPLEWATWIVDFDATGKVMGKGKLVFP